MSNVEERVRREAELYDEQALQRSGLEKMLEYVDEGIGRDRRNEVIGREMAAAQGKTVLEIGSQAWEWCLKKYGYVPAAVTCINISEAELDVGRKHAAGLGFAANFRNMDAHHLQFDDGTFDLVFGVAILHHLDFAQAIREVHRVLRPGGKMVFVEPLILNPMARLVRWMTPKARTPDERPLGREELAIIEQSFKTRNFYNELVTVLGGIVSRPLCRAPINPITRACDSLDRSLLRVFPGLGPYFRTVVIVGERR